MSKIQHLDEHLMNMIAAGEVVERPMGIVKELVENSIDANATRIEVILRDGGMEMIQVIDNGVGMDAEDATLAFERHATSKIHEVKDLWSIGTLGFRGEALPSIASVSHVVLLTSNGEESSRVEIDYGKLISAQPYASNQGTDISVGGLFLRTPARLKHLRSVPYETSLITSVMEKFALSYPNIAFKLVGNDKVILQTTGRGDLVEVIHTLYGNETARNTVTFENHDYDYQVSGVFVLPTINRASRNYITIFINQRMIRSYRLTKAVTDAYENYLAKERFPIVVLNIQMDTQLVDVNVHPSKWEIRLAKEKQLEALIKATIEEELRNSLVAPEIKSLESIVQEKVIFQNLDLSEERKIPFVVKEEEVSKPDPMVVETKEEEIILPDIEEKSKDTFPIMQVIGQLHGKYILAEDENHLYIVDQHAAQEKYHYEQYNTHLEKPVTEFFELLIPVQLEIGSSGLQRIHELNESFNQIGIHLEAFGGNTIVVRKVPVWMHQVDMDLFLKDMIDYYFEERDVSLQKLRKQAIATMACHTSIRFNRHLSKEEMHQVIEDLKSCQDPFHCPHGRPTFMRLADKQLEKEFYR
jgi:DNA mismatch repair protein MutL